MDSLTFLTELEAIEDRLEKEGDTKSVRKGFWRIIGRMKRQDPGTISEPTIKKAAEIRNRLFKQSVILGLNKGLVIFLFVALLALSGFVWILIFFEPTLSFLILLPPFILTIAFNGVLLLVSVLIAYGVYPWGRFLGGAIAGVKFEGFYLYSPGEFGLKIEYTSYLQTTQSRRKWVFGFPIIWVFGSLFLLVLIAGLLNPAGIWAPLLFVIFFGPFYILLYYKKTGELYRFVREHRIAREVKRKQKTTT